MWLAWNTAALTKTTKKLPSIKSLYVPYRKRGTSVEELRAVFKTVTSIRALKHG